MSEVSPKNIIQDLKEESTTLEKDIDERTKELETLKRKYDCVQDRLLLLETPEDAYRLKMARLAKRLTTIRQECKHLENEQDVFKKLKVAYAEK